MENSSLLFIYGFSYSKNLLGKKIKGTSLAIMDARCINCNDKANYDIENSKIICKKCNIEINYDEYIEKMREKALNMADNVQENWEKSGF